MTTQDDINRERYMVKNGLGQCEHCRETVEEEELAHGHCKKCSGRHSECCGWEVSLFGEKYRCQSCLKLQVWEDNEWRNEE